MDVKLENLIEKIRKEGIEEAQNNADEIVKDAKAKAASIVEKAKKDAEKIVDDGKNKSEQFKVNAEADVKQAARNTELLLKEKIIHLFDGVFKKQVGESLDIEFLKSVITNIIETWAKDSGAEIVVSKDDQKKLNAVLFDGLNAEVKEGVSLRVSQELTRGFRIGLKDDKVYYDFSDEAIAEVLKSLLNPSLKEILDN
jgi:V/A-type H+/Na+-transporting ATPase subunit E